MGRAKFLALELGMVVKRTYTKPTAAKHVTLMAIAAVSSESVG